MLEGIMAGGVDPEQIEKFKNLVCIFEDILLKI